MSTTTEESGATTDDADEVTDSETSEVDTNLHELEQSLLSLPGRPSDAPVDHTPTESHAVVKQAGRRGDDAWFLIETKDDGDQEVTLPWPEYDHPSEPLDRLLEAVDLGGLEHFSKIEHRRIPIVQDAEENYHVHIPPRGKWEERQFAFGRTLYHFGFLSFDGNRFSIPDGVTLLTGLLIGAAFTHIRPDWGLLAAGGVILANVLAVLALGVGRTGANNGLV